MKRTLLFVVGISLAVAWWLRPSAKKHDLPDGRWHGKTTQGLPIDFFVSHTDEGPVIDEWNVVRDFACEKTGRIVRTMFWSRMPIPMRDRRFSQRVADLIFWEDWNGTFLSDGEARGDHTGVLPVLIGSALEDLETEKCVAMGIGFSARPGGDEEAEPAAPLDLLLRVERDGQGNVSSTWVSRPAWPDRARR
jgi:hypothetical protein